MWQGSTEDPRPEKCTRPYRPSHFLPIVVWRSGGRIDPESLLGQSARQMFRVWIHHQSPLMFAPMQDRSRHSLWTRRPICPGCSYISANRAVVGNQRQFTALILFTGCRRTRE